MHVTLFIVYFLLLCLAITRMHFFNTSIRTHWLVIFFALHVAAGCIHNWIAFTFYPNHGDIWFFFNESVAMKKELLIHPQQFWHTLVANEDGFNITDTTKPLLNVQYQVLQYMQVVLNFFSCDNLYINTLIFAFPVFAGSVALFKFFYHYTDNVLAALCTLLLPSVLFWTATVYKDGLFYMAMGFCCYSFLQALKHLRYHWAAMLVCTAIMIAARANALLTLLPALFYLWLAEKTNWPRRWLLLTVTATVLVFSAIANTLVQDGLLAAVTERQKDFLLLEGGSRMYLPTLAPNAVSFLNILPVAIVNGWWQPLPGTGGKIIYTAFSAELLCIWTIVLLGCYKLFGNKNIRVNRFAVFCLLFALPGMIIIGYVVPFAGAIIRYRSIYLPFLLAPFLSICCNQPTNLFSRSNRWLQGHIIPA